MLQVFRHNGWVGLSASTVISTPVFAGSARCWPAKTFFSTSLNDGAVRYRTNGAGRCACDGQTVAHSVDRLHEVPLAGSSRSQGTGMAHQPAATVERVQALEGDVLALTSALRLVKG